MFIEVKRIIGFPKFNEKGNFDSIGITYINYDRIEQLDIQKISNPVTKKEEDVSKITLVSGNVLFAKGKVEL